MLGRLSQHRQSAGSVLGSVAAQRGSLPAAITGQLLADDKDSAHAGGSAAITLRPLQKGPNEASRSDQRSEATPLMVEGEEDKMKEDGGSDAAVMSAQLSL